MTCDELRDDYGAFALGVADDPERSEIASHIAANCSECTPGVKDALLTVLTLSGGVKLKNPPKRLRRRVIAMVTRKSPSPWTNGILPWAIAFALSVVVLLIAIPAREQGVEMAKLDQALSIVNDPAAKDVSFTGAQQLARGRVFMSPAKGIVLIAANLPKLDPGKTFELWIIPAGGKPIPAGVFPARDDSTALYIHSGAVTNAAAVAVTVEPEGGSPQPTTTPFITTAL